MSSLKVFSIAGLLSGVLTAVVTASPAHARAGQEAATSASAVIGMSSCWLETGRPNENESMVEGSQVSFVNDGGSLAAPIYKSTYKSAQFDYEVRVEARGRSKASPRVTLWMLDRATGLKSSSDSFVQIDPSTSTQPHGSVLPRIAVSMSVPEREIRLNCL